MDKFGKELASLTIPEGWTLYGFSNGVMVESTTDAHPWIEQPKRYCAAIYSEREQRMIPFEFDEPSEIAESFRDAWERDQEPAEYRHD